MMVLRTPGEKHGRRVGLTPEEIAFSMELGRRVNEGGESASAGYYVISDTMPDTLHMADGKTYSSKSAFRNATKAAGCIEVGNEVQTLVKPRKPIELDRRERRDAIRQAIYDAKNGIRRY